MIHLGDTDCYHVVLDSINGNAVHYFVSRLNGCISVDLNELAFGMGFNGLADLTREKPEQLEILAQTIGFQDSTRMFMHTPGLMDQYLDCLNQDGVPQPGMLALVGNKTPLRKEG
jgi:hypothetical protein